MGIKKNAAPAAAEVKKGKTAPAAAKPEVKKTAAAPAKAEVKKAATKAADKPAAEAVEKVAVEKIGRKQLAEAIVAKVKATGKGIPSSIAEIMVGAYEEAVGEALAAGKEVNLPGFGKFVVTHKPAGTARNPATNEEIATAAKNVPKFKVGAKLKAAVNGGAEEAEVEGEEAE